MASQHSFSIADTWDSRCRVCHADANGDPENIRIVHLADFDGDGVTSESLRAEIDGMAAALLVAMRGAVGAPGLFYEPAAYPYFFRDPSGDGVCSAEEAIAANAFTPWTARAHASCAQLPAQPQRPRRLGAQLRLHRPTALRQHRTWVRIR